MRTSAALAFGLSENSRSKLKLSGRAAGADTLLLALICDHLADLCWIQTEDGRKGRNRPESIYKRLSGRDKETESYIEFSSPEAYEAARAQIRGD